MCKSFFSVIEYEGILNNIIHCQKLALYLKHIYTKVESVSPTVTPWKWV